MHINGGDYENMLDKKDMIRLIDAYTAINKINNSISEMTGGYPIDNEIYNGIYNLYDIIFEHSKFAGRTDDDALNEFRAIMNGIWLSSEERYSLLI